MPKEERRKKKKKSKWPTNGSSEIHFEKLQFCVFGLYFDLFFLFLIQLI